MNNETKDAVKRTRSPNYPYIDLESALQRAQEVWDHDGRNPVPVGSLAEHWKYSPTSSSLVKVIAALRQFGLFQSDDGDHLRLSDSAIRILSNEDTASPERIELIKKSALSPKLYAHLWEKYQNQLPSDSTLRHHLLADVQFNKDIVSSVIQSFRKTIAFAKLVESDKVATQKQEEKPLKTLEQQQNRAEQANQNPPPPPKDNLSLLFGHFQPQTEVREFSFPLPGGVATVRVPYPLTEESFKVLVNTVISFKDGLVRRPEPFVLDAKEGKEIWVGKALKLARLGYEFNVINIDFSAIDDAEEISHSEGLDLKLDLHKGFAFFRNRPKQGDSK